MERAEQHFQENLREAIQIGEDAKVAVGVG